MTKAPQSFALGLFEELIEVSMLPTSVDYQSMQIRPSAFRAWLHLKVRHLQQANRLLNPFATLLLEVKPNIVCYEHGAFQKS